jgi:ammonium transporter Rh
MKKTVIDAIFYGLMLVTQILAAVFYGVYHDHIIRETDVFAPEVNTSFAKFPLFQDIHVMVFIGIGFLFAYLKNFRLSAITNVFWIAALSVQYYFLWDALFDGAWNRFGHFTIWTMQLIRAEYCAMAMAIAIGAVSGKANNLQLVIITLIGVLLFSVNEHILFQSLDVSDIGGSMFIFTFGGFYGVGVTAILNNKTAKKSPNYTSNVNSSAVALVGTLFLWCFFPSFNSAMAATPVQSNISAINTYFCLIGSALSAFFMSNLLHQGRFHIEHILNATLTGGILMGAGANLLHESFVAFIVGNLGGIISVAMFKYLNAILNKVGLMDSAGVLYSFAIPGLLGGLLSSIYRARYFERGGIQVAGTFISLGIALLGGLLVGILVRFLGYYLIEDEYFNDSTTAYFDDVLDYRVQSKNQSGRPLCLLAQQKKELQKGAQADQKRIIYSGEHEVFPNE